MEEVRCSTLGSNAMSTGSAGMTQCYHTSYDFPILEEDSKGLGTASRLGGRESEMKRSRVVQKKKCVGPSSMELQGG